MLPTRIIETKRDGGHLSPDELSAFLRAYLEGSVAEYQMSAFLMATFIRGLDRAELSALLREMIESGARLRFTEDGPPAVDKHSTGGVGDKVSLVLAPLLAAAGLRVPMMSGRGLGHTGGTLDKLEAIPGFDVSIDVERFQAILDEVGCAMIGQTRDIAPLDGRLYALRDVTGTVPSPPLIAASIVSKKVAEGIGALVLDVKCGRGAFMTDREQARALARTMVDLAAGEGVRTSALLTAMDAPLGGTVGNALEVREAIETLQGGGPADLRGVTLALGAELLVSAGRAPGIEEAAAELGAVLDGGRALERFAQLIELQGGDAGVVADPGRLPCAPICEPFRSPGSGWLDVHARKVGVASVELGAGRRRVEDAVDPRVGFEFHRRAGDRVSEGERLLTVHAADADSAATAIRRLGDAIELSAAPPPPRPLILERVAGRQPAAPG